MDLPSGKTILSGIQPSGTLHIGNYLGAIAQWVVLQDKNTAYFCIVDQHAITVPYDAKKLPGYVLDTAAAYLAAGLDPDKSTIFVQSHVPAHTEIAWLLATQTPFGELTRMTQFKDKSGRQQDNTTLGLFAYPVLQAADILLYQTDFVPVGEDQKQHIELTRNIARRFNNKFGQTFNIPQELVNQKTAKIMSLQTPTAKMSKSDNEKSYIALTDEPDMIRKKIMSAVTETEFNIRLNTDSIRNLRTIYQAFSGDTDAQLENTFSQKGYKEFKESLSDLLIEKLSPIRARFRELRNSEDELHRLLADGRHKADQVASQTLKQAKQQMGLL